MSSKYELLRDLPTFRAGEIFTKESCEDYYNVDGHSYYHRIDGEIVRNKKSWFKEIKEPTEEQSSKPFEWTDELVAEIVREWGNETNWEVCKKRVEIFKQTKLRNQTLKAGEGTSISVGRTDGKDWEIVDMIWGDNYVHKQDGTCDGNCRIHSVKRLSDGEVFSVGDELWDKLFLRHEKIEKFEMEGEMLKVCMEYGGFLMIPQLNKEKISKPQPQQESKRIEVTVLNNGFAGEQICIRPNYSGHKIPKDKNDLIKRWLEWMLNSDEEATGSYMEFLIHGKTKNYQQ